MIFLPSFVLPPWLGSLKIVASRCEHCHRLVVLRKFTAHKNGIRMHGAWYCGARCFTAAAEREIVRLLNAALALATHTPRMPLGLSMLSRGLLTAEQLKKATDEQKETGADIGEILVRQGAVTEKQVTDIRSAEWGCPVFAFPERAAQFAIRIPPALLEAYCMIPVHFVAATNLLFVGFVHGVDYGLLYTVEQLTGCKTTPCFLTPSSFQTKMQQARQVQSSAMNKTSSFESLHTPAEIARTLCTHALEMEADEAFIGRCREYVWARLKSSPSSVDLLFKVRK